MNRDNPRNMNTGSTHTTRTARMNSSRNTDNPSCHHSSSLGRRSNSHYSRSNSHYSRSNHSHSNDGWRSRCVHNTGSRCTHDRGRTDDYQRIAEHPYTVGFQHNGAGLCRTTYSHVSTSASPVRFSEPFVAPSPPMRPAIFFESRPKQATRLPPLQPDSSPKPTLWFS